MQTPSAQMCLSVVTAPAMMLLVVATVAADDSTTLMFEKDIRPIFRTHCYDCHGAVEEVEGGLDLRQVRRMTSGGQSGPAIVPGDAEASYLVQRVVDGEMPPSDVELPKADIETLRRWIAEGAPTARPEPESIGPGLGLTDEERSFWSFQPIRRPDVPELPGDERIRTPIDALLRVAMPDGFTFSADADRATLIRRVYFDVTGLPPAPEEMTRWLSDSGDDWYERLVDELLASPHYGERWARHWLDVAGYADSEGYNESDTDRAWAWKYRDYVIRSLNADKPLDTFIVEQLAGDELAGPRQGDLTPEQIELYTATGFLRMAADGTGSGADDPVGRNRVVSDTIRIVSTSLLGVSVGCAECHDHRYDPVPQTDYYALRAVFEPAFDWQAWKTPPQRLVSLYTESDRQIAAEVEAEAKPLETARNEKQAKFMAEALAKELEKYDEPLREQLRTAYNTPTDEQSDEQKALLNQHPSVNITTGNLYQYLPEAAEELKKDAAKLDEVRAKKPAEEFVRALIEPADHVVQTRLFHRGDHQQPKQVVAPAGLSVVSPDGEWQSFADDDPELPSTGRRLAFARWLTGGDQPLVARVIVNRIWMHHFGRGIVATPSDFGRLGAAPTHPDLLDWLADEFVQQGWSLKQLHRLILTSTAWRQAAGRTPELDAIDSSNRFYCRQSVVRLEAEALRDRTLAVTGQLDRMLFGAPVAVQADDSGQVVVAGDQTRRSLYVRVRRSQPVAMMQAFDAPVMQVNCESRPVSTVATQSLMLMNGEFILTQARKLADRVAAETATTEGEVDEYDRLPEQISRAWQLALCREPNADELQMALVFVARQVEHMGGHTDALPKDIRPDQQAMANLCQALMTCNEFLYVD
jgi:hypothetical protein